ncbi:Protoheme IX farnesyltransferase [Raphanus sativus]|nr:Protoheme IX farnesyltransferase [Raphanus sativus]
MEKARKMFHASLLFLPVFMSGLLIHPVYDDNYQPVVELTGLSNSATGEVIKTLRKKETCCSTSCGLCICCTVSFPSSSFLLFSMKSKNLVKSNRIILKLFFEFNLWY